MWAHAIVQTVSYSRKWTDLLATNLRGLVPKGGLSPVLMTKERINLEIYERQNDEAVRGSDLEPARGECGAQRARGVGVNEALTAGL